MTKPMKILLMAVMALLLTSCGVRYHETLKQFDKVNLSNVSLGMTKAEVQIALNKKPDNTVVAERDVDNHLVEVLQFSQWETTGSAALRAPDKRIDSYWLYFVNDKLEKWHQIRPEDKRPMDYRH